MTEPDEVPDWGEAEGEEIDERPAIPRRRGGRFFATRQKVSDIWGRSSEQDRFRIIGQMDTMGLKGESICQYALGSNDVPEGTESVFDLDTLYAFGKRKAGENGLSSAKIMISCIDSKYVIKYAEAAAEDRETMKDPDASGARMNVSALRWSQFDVDEKCARMNYKMRVLAQKGQLKLNM